MGCEADLCCVSMYVCMCVCVCSLFTCVYTVHLLCPIYVCCACASHCCVFYPCTSVFGCMLCLYSGNGPGRGCVWSEGNYGHAPREEEKAAGGGAPREQAGNAAPAFLSLSLKRINIGQPRRREEKQRHRGRPAMLLLPFFSLVSLSALHLHIPSQPQCCP